MNTNLLRLNVGLGGNFLEASTQNLIDGKICQLLEILQSSLSSCSLSEFDGKEQECRMEFYASPQVSGDGWERTLQHTAYPVRTLVFSKEEREKHLERSESITYLNTSATREIEKRNFAINWLVDQSDLLLLVWNEDPGEQHGLLWDTVQCAHRKNVPCVWISSKSGAVYWAEDSYFQPFLTEYVDAWIRTLIQGQVAPTVCGKRHFPLFWLGKGLNRHFLKKHKAQNTEAPVEKDAMLKEEFDFSDHCPQKKRVQMSLLRQFKRFDQSAMELSERYRVAIYWRSVLPFLATVFLAVGFYADTLLGYCFHLSGVSINLWSIFAGTGFLIHAFLNLYVYYLSKNKEIQRWHQGFLKDRFIAETLRILTHFVPYGITVNIRGLLNRRERNQADTQRLYAEIRKILRNVEPCSATIDQETLREILSHVREMLDDQLDYNKKAAARYQRMTDRLTKWSKWVFYIGFVLILLRGILQFFLVYVPITGERFDISTAGFIRSFANMLALMLPAWASYFTSKLGQCNYDYLKKNHEWATDSLCRAKALVEEISGMENIPASMLSSFADEITELMLLEDTYNWFNRISFASITKL